MSSRRVGKPQQHWNKDIKRGGRSQETTKWLRNHSASVKPHRLARLIDTKGNVYIHLSNGQLVKELTARKLGV